MTYRRIQAFTLIELVIVLTILAILAAVAIPIFGTIRTQTRNSATKGAVMAIREAITQYRMNEIASGRTDGSGTGIAAGWPGHGQVTDRHCSGYNAALPHIMANADLPPNPWGSVATHVTVGNEDCVTLAGGIPLKGEVNPGIDTGWRYRGLTNGEIWANTAVNDGAQSGGTENCPVGGTTENCY